MKKSVASTIEYCYADQAIARLAEALGHRDDAILFQRHGRFYRNLWNPETQFFQPRDSRRTFLAEFKPEMLTYVDVTGKFTHAYVEGSAWQWRWGVPSDAAELVSLFKSREFFVQELEQFFARSPAGVGLTPNAYYWHGNQPDLYAAYLFNHADRPDLTQKWVRWILETKYGDRENGLDGNDDGGTLSAWYVLSSLGLFPTAGTDRYEISGPLWERAEIQLQDQRLTILADNAAPNHPYIQKVWLNDKLLDRYWIQHAEIAGGGTLRFEMGRTGNRPLAEVGAETGIWLRAAVEARITRSGHRAIAASDHRAAAGSGRARSRQSGRRRSSRGCELGPCRDRRSTSCAPSASRLAT